MAGNSVPVFFGAKARTKRPPGLDVTFTTDLSGSMVPFAAFVSSISTCVALENELISQGIGILSPNRYSFATGGGIPPQYDSLQEIERFVTSSGVSRRWATGSEVLASAVSLPTLNANLTNSLTEDMRLSTNILANSNRDYLPANTKIIISSSDEQSNASVTPFDLTPVYPYRYVGVHSVTIAISEPAGPNPVPAGLLTGFVYTTNTIGTAIYINGSTINYRTDVPVANVTATAAASGVFPNLVTFQELVDHAKTTNGAIYNLNFFQGVQANLSFVSLAESLGNVLGKLLFETS
jgi:hypothetical protein